MPNADRNATVSTWGAVDVTLGKVAFTNLLAAGSAADSTITILDGNAIKYVIAVGSTVSNVIFAVSRPVAFQNLIVDLTGTASFSICSVPTTR